MYKLDRKTRAYVCLALFVAFSPSGQANTLARYQYSRIRMGTLIRIVMYASSETQADEAAEAAFARIEELDEAMSDYKQDSELMRLCREADKVAKKVSDDLWVVLERSLKLSQMTDGAFDITVGPVVALWRQARRTKRLPDPEELARAKAAVGYRNIKLDPKNRTVRLARPDIKLDLGGIAKGYAADQALLALRSRGIRSALVDAGGDIALGEPPPGKRGWAIAIQSPDPNDHLPEKILILHDVAVATSGDTEQFIEIDGARYSHIVDPKTGLGVRDSASVTVIAQDAITADALATALSVLPVGRGLRLVESMEGVAAYMVRRSGDKFQRLTSRGMEKLLKSSP